MKRYCIPTSNDNRPYQQQIALSLVHSLGMDDAIDFCVQNGCDETLSVILKDERHFAETSAVTIN